jgi:hypothetical protein
VQENRDLFFNGNKALVRKQSVLLKPVAKLQKRRQTHAQDLFDAAIIPAGQQLSNVGCTRKRRGSTGPFIVVCIVVFFYYVGEGEKEVWRQKFRAVEGVFVIHRDGVGV